MQTGNVGHAGIRNVVACSTAHAMLWRRIKTWDYHSLDDICRGGFSDEQIRWIRGVCEMTGADYVFVGRMLARDIWTFYRGD